MRCRRRRERHFKCDSACSVRACGAAMVLTRVLEPPSARTLGRESARVSSNSGRWLSGPVDEAFHGARPWRQGALEFGVVSVRQRAEFLGNRTRARLRAFCPLQPLESLRSVRREYALVRRFDCLLIFRLGAAGERLCHLSHCPLLPRAGSPLVSHAPIVSVSPWKRGLYHSQRSHLPCSSRTITASAHLCFAPGCSAGVSCVWV